jgi:hypothetical protein
MREISFINPTNHIYRVKYRTTDLITEAYGKIFLDLDFSLMSGNSALKSTATITSEGLTFTRELNENKCSFDLSWMKYFAPQHGTRDMSVKVLMNNFVAVTIVYKLTAGRGEVDVKRKTFQNLAGEEYYTNEKAILARTMRTKHWDVVELLYKNGNVNIKDGESAYELRVSRANTLSIIIGDDDTGIYTTTLSTKDEVRLGYVRATSDGGSGRTIVVDEYNVIDATCADIELRITNRHGLRGAIGGKLVDASEGGSDVRTNYSNSTIPYAGVFSWCKEGSVIKKEVAFNFNGDADLLALLRDACVYGNVEWFDEKTQTWLPCKIEDKSVDNDPWKEQIITIVLQQL